MVTFFGYNHGKICLGIIRQEFGKSCLKFGKLKLQSKQEVNITIKLWAFLGQICKNMLKNIMQLSLGVGAEQVTILFFFFLYISSSYTFLFLYCLFHLEAFIICYCLAESGWWTFFSTTIQ